MVLNSAGCGALLKQYGELLAADPAWAQGITRQPRELLQAVPGALLIEMPATEACCGSAGIYGLGGEAQAAVSMALLGEKLQDASATEAEVVVTANPGCLMHLRYGAARDGKRFEVLHLAEFLDRMLGGGERHG